MSEYKIYKSGWGRGREGDEREERGQGCDRERVRNILHLFIA